MLHVLVILMLAAIAVHDVVVRDSAALGRHSEGAAGWWTLTVVIVPLMVLSTLAWLVCRAAGTFLDYGRGRALLTAERTNSAARVGAVCLHAANVLVFGWLDLVRSVIGDVVVIDELMAITPPLLVFCATWAAQYPLEKRVRDAVTLRQLDAGCTVYPMPSRWQFVLGNFRHQVLLSLVPITMLLAWAEGAERSLDWLASHRGAASGVLAWLGGVASDQSTRSSALLAVQFIGVGVVLSVAPLAMRFVWDTVRLSPGPLRERLIGMCEQHNVGVRELLVWRTHGSMINGAVMGLWGQLRYILLTDALLDSLPRQQVEAVMAHELGHVRHRHVVWLAGVLIASLLGLSLVASVALWAWASVIPMARAGQWGGNVAPFPGAAWAIGELGLELGSAAAMLGGTLCIFAFVSRRFEWQADAFAAMHLSTPGALGPPPAAQVTAVTEDGVAAEAREKGEQGAGLVLPEAVAAMAGALGAVSRLNSIPLERGSFRHGSLGVRIRKLRRLAGVSAGKMPIDRTVRRIKIATLVTGVLVGAVLCAATWYGL